MSATMSQATAKARNAKTSMYRSLIIDAAERLFASRGYEGTKIQDIASESGISLGTLYSVFDGKSDIYEAVQDERLGRLFLLAGRTMASDDKAAERLMRGNRVFIRWLTEHPDFLRIHLNNSGAWASNPQEVGEGLVNAWRRGIDLIALVIDEAMREGDAFQGDSVIAARTMVAIQQVHMSAWVESGMQSDADHLADRIEEQLRRTLFRSK
ncbi:MAG: TetR/AcrR family transcriptional regulator [Deltaproteobacteria bacterium]|jgi:AcrR family transcriptional regulator|nr:TetR/AcrR family transcriptional regulator [Deltaproteobacteria bacterium]MBW2213517.1 TetR/AcrR family transcriptional regulator [Deltaproteobacteria bacterium]MBW2626733.1 TetR/AcrR family transcriptional regulator [Deltaproteobacteria bacterium]MBW2686304.1 TetR/AcrR family transcriptional regulator [Deltaproteobacteria bacterium]